MFLYVVQLERGLRAWHGVELYDGVQACFRYSLTWASAWDKINQWYLVWPTKFLVIAWRLFLVEKKKIHTNGSEVVHAWRRRIQPFSNVKNEHFYEVPFHELSDVSTRVVPPKLTTYPAFARCLYPHGHAQRDCWRCDVAYVRLCALGNRHGLASASFCLITKSTGPCFWRDGGEKIQKHGYFIGNIDSVLSSFPQIFGTE